MLYEGLEDVLYGVPGHWSCRRCVNGACRHIWLDPAPIEKDIGAAYAQYFTHQDVAMRPSLPKRIFRHVRASYVRSRLGYERATAGSSWRWLAPLGHLHPGSGDVFSASVMFLRAPSEGSALLDIGAGGGDFIDAMRELGWKVSGVETDPVAAGRAQSRGLDVYHGDLSSAGFAGGSFDAITMAHVVEHLHEPGPLLHRCRNLLKPGGRLVILTPNSAGWGHRHFGRDWLGLDPPRHLHLFNAANIRSLLLAAGLTPVRISTLAINASAVWPASAAIRRARLSPAGPSEHVALRTTPGGLIAQVAERMRLIADPAAGEDLLAIATPAAP